jgi:DNA-directed RNA polymerase subunit H (RpoH/RPB5)
MSDAQYVQYENAHIFATEWRKMKVASKKLNKEDFRKNLQMDKYIEINCISDKGRPTTIYLLLRDVYYASTMDLKRMISKIKKPGEVIIISDIVINIHINKIIENNKHLEIYFYNYEIMSMIIPNAPLSGKHRILSNEERHKLLNDVLICDINNLSKIAEDDPQCIWLGARPGSVLEIISPSYITHEYVTYKIVIPRSSKRFLKFKDEKKEEDEVSEKVADDEEENEPEEQETEVEQEDLAGGDPDDQLEDPEDIEDM